MFARRSTRVAALALVLAAGCAARGAGGAVAFLRCGAGSLAVHSLALGMMSLLPLRAGGLGSDGLLLWRVLTGAEAEGQRGSES
jgi:hypothetical protein